MGWQLDYAEPEKVIHKLINALRQKILTLTKSKQWAHWRVKIKTGFRMICANLTTAWVNQILDLYHPKCAMQYRNMKNRNIAKIDHR